ncbi:hypothetical protein F6455_09545 [Proteobacteria bacterium 005FR1]|nr:hypothetical protein [Proteobacteria bacterium 005FR1]
MSRPWSCMLALILPTAILLSACESTSQTPRPETGRLVEVECQDPRPEVCTFQYAPVCGLVDTGTRCVTTPCPASEWRTFSNGCSACSSPDVIGYREGACDDSSADES